MVLTAAQTTAFFEDAAQMGIPHTTVIQLQAEGITTVDDLADFDKDSLQQLAEAVVLNRLCLLFEGSGCHCLFYWTTPG